MDKENAIGNINTELEEIERMNEIIQETNDIYRYTNTGALLSILCC